ncbi:DinB family protein [Streptomyces sp. GSL17-111]|uniref:DinB family protein n=1 Tax=Streptomyces sp. GSL17-111 TaxID=3121596 RepID=UPI0030F3E740
MTTPPRTRPAYDADERTQLLGWLDMQRAIVHWKCAGLSEEDAHRPVLPSSPAMTVAGLVAHLRWVERDWFEMIFLGLPGKGPKFESAPDVEDPDMRVDDVPLADLLRDYERQCARSNEVIAAHELDEKGRHPDFRAASASLRWVLFHMIEETARHVGHLDAMREILDGETGYY